VREPVAVWKLSADLAASRRLSTVPLQLTPAAFRDSVRFRRRAGRLKEPARASSYSSAGKRAAREVWQYGTRWDLRYVTECTTDRSAAEGSGSVAISSARGTMHVTGFVWGSVSSFGESVAVRGEPKAHFIPF